MYSSMLSTMICQRVAKLSSVQSQQLISHNNSTASIRCIGKQDQQFRNPEAFLPDARCFPLPLSFPPQQP